VKLDVRSATGAAQPQIDVDDSVFGIEPNAAVVHQALLAQLAARRAGSAKTKSRGEVRGSTRKTRRQKGLGTSRQGAIRSPLRRGGGVVFGPVPHSYVQRLPKRMRRLAIRSVLSSRAAEQRLVVVDGLGIDAPSTRAVVGLLSNLGVERSALIVTGSADRSAHLSARNVDGVRALPADTLNVGDLLSHHTVLLTVDAVRRIEALWGGERVTDRRAPVAVEA
jgi:large subunit ribosomal protein L4